MSSTENPTSPATQCWTYLLAVYWLGLVMLTATLLLYAVAHRLSGGRVMSMG